MSKFKNRFNTTALIGKTFHLLTVVNYSHCVRTKTHSTHYWLCKCQCGNLKEVQNSHLVHNSTRSCGCDRYNPKHYPSTHTPEKLIHFHDSITENENGCKLWPLTLNDKGYGKISFENKTCEAHRVIYRCFYGEITKGLVIRHLCNNPACINIKHLKIGSRKDNAQDAVKAGSYRVGEKHHSAKLTEEIVRYIRENEMEVSNSVLARKYPVSRKNIERIKTRKIWKKKLNV